MDLVTSIISAPTTAYADSNIDISWSVTNQGTESSNANFWYDYVLLSTDTVVDFPFGTDITLTGGFPNITLPLGAGEGYTYNQSVSIPEVLAGDYYLLFVNDIYNSQPDTNPTNDVVVVPFTVEAEPDGADLSILYNDAPSSAGAGKEIDLSWTVINEGNLTTNVSEWYDYVLLSPDTKIDLSGSNPDLTIISEKIAEETGQLPLDPQENYTSARRGTIPDSVAAGDYYLLFVTDNDKEQDESDENNNFISVPFTVLDNTNYIDLVTTDVSAPMAATAGTSIGLSWTVANQGTIATDVPYWFDYVLLSNDTKVDFIFTFASDISLTVFNPEAILPLEPGEDYTVSQDSVVLPNNLVPGLYYLLFVNNIYDLPLDFTPTNDVVVVPFSVVTYTMTGSVASELMAGTDASEMLQALEGRDEILGHGGDDVIIGGSGGDRIIGGAGRDRFVYQTSRDLGDTIVDFTIGEDKIDLSQLLDSFNYLGNNPIDDGYLRLVQGTNGTSVQVDGDGSTGSSIFRPFIFLENVASNDLTLKDFII